MSEVRIAPAQLLGAGVQLTTELASYYTSVGASSQIDQCTFTNMSNQRVRVMALHLVQVGDQASDLTTVLTRMQLQPFETYSCDELVGHVLEVGASVQAYADTPGVITLRMSGRVGV